MSRAQRDAYIALRQAGVPQWEAFRRLGGGSSSQCGQWERWFRAAQGLPRREPSPMRAARWN